MSKDTSPFAFPIPMGEATQAYMYNKAQHGMSLRDYFAGQALAGIMANPDMVRDAYSKSTWQAQTCYLMADAMLGVRNDD